MADEYNLTNEQENLAEQLSMYDQKIKDSYIAAIYAINQKDYPGRLISFAHLLREVIDLLARTQWIRLPKNDKKYTFSEVIDSLEKIQHDPLFKNDKKYTLEKIINLLTNFQQNSSFKNDKKHTLGKPVRINSLKAVIDPLGKHGYRYDDKYQKLEEEYEDLSEMAHQRKHITNNLAQQHLSVIEDILIMFTMLQNEIYDEIDDIISRSPNIRDAKTLVGLDFRWTNLQYIINNLSEDWITIMFEAGFFKNPQPTEINNNFPSYPYWAPSKYLVKCTKSYPKIVTKIIVECVFDNKRHRNPSVYVDFLVCMLDLSINDVVKISQKILDEHWHDFINEYWFAEKYIDVMEKLYLAGKYDIAIKFAYNAFRPKPSQHMEMLNYAVNTPFDSYWYNEILRKKIPHLLQKNPELIIKLIADLLDESIRLSINKNTTDATFDNYSYIWRPAIETSEQNLTDDLRSMFVTTLQNSLIYLGNNKTQLKHIMNILNQKNYMIYRRLELYVYTQFPDMFMDKIPSVLLKYLYHYDTHHEYYHLIKKIFPNLSYNIKQQLYKLIDSDFNFTQRNSISNKNITCKDKNYYKYKCLESIKDHLDKDHRKIYLALNKEFGQLEHADYHIYNSINVGESVIESKLFENKTINQVFDFIKNYPNPNSLKIYDDILSSFEEYVQSNPLNSSKKSMDLIHASTMIQSMLFSGLEKSIQAKNIDWKNLLSLIENIVSNTHKKPNNNLGYYDPILQICILIKKGLDNDRIDYELRNRIWKIIILLVNIGTDRDEIEDYPAKNTHSLDISINNVAGLSFHTVCHYAMWCDKHSTKKRILVPEAKQIFDRYINKKFGNHTISRHAVLGVFLLNFYYLDSDWIKSRLQKILSGKNTKIAFWDGYISWNNLHRYVYDDLHTSYREFLNKDLIRNLDLKRPYHSTISHSILAYFYDYDNTDDYVEKFLKEPDESAIKHCIYQISTTIKNKNLSPKFNKQKLIKLWKQDSIIKQDLDRWLRDSPLDKKTTINLYLNYVQKHQKFNLLHTSISKLSSYVDTSPSSVVECLDILIDKKENNYINDDIKMVLESLLNINDTQITNLCEKIIKKISRFGPDWRDLL